MFEKLLNVLSKNLGYTVVLVAAILLFAVFSDGLIAGLITAVSALLAYTCIVALYKEYKALPAKKTAGTRPVKRTASKKK
ncbi:MAG: hypothetical protein J6Q44_03455 [Alphaproteobacteria bacterium]|nr:hypothetical protein [Alphaproteobacteria bacterium]